MTDLPDLKIKSIPQFPSSILGGDGIEVTKANGHVTVDLAHGEFATQTAIPTSPTNTVLTFDTATGSYINIPTQLLGGAVAGISDAPSDATFYGRKSAGWVHPAVADVTGLQTALNAKAALASPAFTGNPTAPTPTAGDNDTSLATTAFVQAAVSGGGNFIQAGTGAVTRTMQNKAREHISVMDFGAVGDGTANDHDAIVNAFAAAAGREVLFPAGKTYLNSTAIAAPANSRAYIEAGATITGNLPTGVDYLYEKAQATATVGSLMKIDHLREASDNYKTRDTAYLWPGGATYSYDVITKSFGPGDGSGYAPMFGSLTHVINTGAAGEVVATGGMAIAVGNNQTVFGANFLALANVVTNAKMFGVEIDWEPSIGTTIDPNSVGFNLVGFTADQGTPAMIIGTNGGGKWGTAISILNGITAGGTCIGAQSSVSCGSFCDASAGTWQYGSYILGNGESQQIYIKGPSSQAAGIYADTGGNFNIKHSSGAAITWAQTSTEGAQTWSIRNSTGGEGIAISSVSGSLGNASNTTLRIRQCGGTTRSINAGGSINQNGLDYAEYETKRDDCATVAKGQIIGFDADGLITDQWALAVSFGVKSTSPGLVGGDGWFTEEPPAAPIPPELKYDGPEAPTPSIRVADGETKRLQAIFDAARKSHGERLAALVAEWRATVYAKYEADKAQFEADLEEAREMVDRIAYCGKVPVNMTAAVGDYIVPIEFGGGIAGQAVAAPTFDQYRIAVGRVRRVLEDGRAEIVVKVI